MLFAYVVVRDFGFAPNPFHGACTLATCKPEIRSAAKQGDWVAGIGSVTKGYGGRLVYAMQVSEALTFNEYWADERFLKKHPYLSGSKKFQYGDNIYHCGAHGGWVQEDSHHSLDGGEENVLNSERDLSADKVLVGSHYYYFGRDAPEVPEQFADIRKARRGHICHLPPQEVAGFLTWLQREHAPGCHGLPIDW